MSGAPAIGIAALFLLACLGEVGSEYRGGWREPSKPNPPTGPVEASPIQPPTSEPQKPADPATERDIFAGFPRGAETCAGIPGAMIASTSNNSSSNPARLEDVVRDEGFGEQPHEFPTIPTQANWMPRYLAGVNGTVIPAPSFHIRITEPAKLAAPRRITAT